MSKYQEDEALLKKLRTGDQLVWKDFFEIHSQPFLLFIMKFSGIDKEEAIQKYQDVIVIFHRKVKNDDLQLPLQSALRTYLFGIGKKLCHQKGNSKTISDEIPEVAIPPSIELDVDQRHTKELVRKLLNQLDVRCRNILTLIFIKGYSKEAVANALKMPSEGAVRKGQFDCLKKLRNMLSD